MTKPPNRGGQSQLASASPAADIGQVLPAVDCSSRPCIALTFDDGPSPEVTSQILSILEQKHAGASFFLIGQKVLPHRDLVLRMNRDGFEIGNHTWSHTDLRRLSSDQFRSELLSTQSAIMLAGAPKPELFRPPYGAVNQQIVDESGLQIALWNEDPEDWQAKDPAKLTDAILRSARPGGVIDLHDTHQITADVLPGVIDQLAAQNYQFVTVSQLLHSRSRPDSAPFYGYAAPW